MNTFENNLSVSFNAIGAPDYLVYAIATLGDLKSYELFPEEKELAEVFGSKKRAVQFKLGRIAARKVQDKLGFIEKPVLLGSQGRPVWGYVNIKGSISHTEEFAMCVCTIDSNVSGVGLDIELENRVITKAAYRRILTENERQEISNVRDADTFALQVFSFKEAIYKAYQHSYKTSLHFKDVDVLKNESSAWEMSFVDNGLSSQFEKAKLFCIKEDGMLISIAVL